ncbi:MAG: hypothetical protein PHV39_02630 [Methanomicrobium sp.]|nr:hypothetical protein [Methanomicrobium sp.]
MQEIKISDSIYNEILSRKKGRESISKTLERELKPVKKEVNKSKALQELDEIKKGKFYTRTQVEKMLAD